MSKKITQKQLLEYGLQLNQSLFQQMKLGFMNINEFDLEVLEQAQENPYLEVKFNAFYKSTAKNNTFLENLGDPVIAEQNPIFKDLEEEILFLPLSVQQKWIASVIVSSILPTGVLSVSLESIAHYTKTTLSNVKEVFLELNKITPIFEVSENPLHSILTRIFPNKDNLDTSNRYISRLIAISDKQGSLSEADIQITQKGILEQISEEKKIEYQEIFNKIHDILYELLRINNLYKSSKQEDALVIKPDCTISIQDMELIITLNQDVILNIKQGIDPITEKEKKLFSTAQSLLKSYNKRQTFLETYITTLVKYQKKFFFSSDKILLPLLQKDLADILKVNPSTISRIAKNKYFLFQGKVYSWNILFSKYIKGKNENTSISKDQIFLEIRNILNITKDFKITDSLLQRLLQNKGIFIARRTVNKYRKLALNSTS